MHIQYVKEIVLLTFISFLLTNCNGGHRQVSENKIQFDSIQVEKTYHLFNNPDNPNCDLLINFVYPSQYADKEILKKIQTTFILDYFGEPFEDMTPQEATGNYVTDYIEAYKSLEPDFEEEYKRSNGQPSSSWFSYYENMSGHIAFNKIDLISYTVSFSTYTGGAHGASAYNNHVVDLKTGDLVTESDLFIANYQDLLAEMLVDALVKDFEVSAPADLENIGFFSVEEIFPNGNFLITEHGLTYTFNQYEIAAYAVGPINVLLPYDELEIILKRESPIADLVWN